MRRLYAVIAFFAFTTIVSAEYRSISDAQCIAAAFMQQKGFDFPSDGSDFTEASISSSNKVKGFTHERADYYILNAPDSGGYVIVSSDDRCIDVLGYSTSGSLSYENMSDGLQYLLSALSSEIKSATEYYDDEGIQSVETVRPLLSANYQSVSPLLTTHWGQNYPFNAQVPISYSGSYSIFHGRASVGCVALAMAQVMNYWKYPARSQGGTYYNNSYDNIYVDFSQQTYNWDDIATEYGAYVDDNGKYKNAAYTRTQMNEVAKLCYHLGVAVNMSWNVDGEGSSGTFEDYIPSALAIYFGYNPYAKLRYREMLGVEGFSKNIIEDLTAGRPVIMAANNADGGHCFILDGYDATTGLFHINWGWQGSDNAYYAISALKPSGKKNFISDQVIVSGLQPTSEDFGFGPSIYCKEISLSKTSLYKGQQLSAKVDTLLDSDFLFNGKVGLAVFDSDGNLKVNAIDESVEAGYYYIDNTFYITFPKSMSAGTYTMYLAMQDSDGKIYPVHAAYGNTESWTVTVSSGMTGSVRISANEPISTGIENVESMVESAAKSVSSDDFWYTTTGVRVQSPGKGIYIRNGKKYVFR